MTPESARQRSDAVDRPFDDLMRKWLAGADANDTQYAFNATRDCDPAAELEKIAAPLIAISFADDQFNPPELGILEREIKRAKRGKHVAILISDGTHGHCTHSLPKPWKEHLARLLAVSEREGFSGTSARH